MNLKSTFIAAVAVLGLAASVSAQTVINITGATAFREAAHAAIRASLDVGHTYGYAGSNIALAGRAIFRGTSGGNPVVIRTSWSGSVAGIRAVVNQVDNVSYYAATQATYDLLTTSGTPNLSASTENTTANFIAFADNTQDNTPFTGVTLSGGPVGVIAFVPAINETARIASKDNITRAQLQRLVRFGSAPLQFVTGNPADTGIKIYWTGRQDTSGTRVIYTSELGLGYGAAVNQWRVEPLDRTEGTVTGIQLWPTGDTSNRSIIYRGDLVGNGGYSSGGDLAPLLKRTSAGGVVVKDASGNPIANETNKEIVLITVISSQDANDIQTGGGKVLAYNGVSIEPEALPTGLNAADRNKIAKGLYTFWSYENLYYRPEVLDSPITSAFISALEANVPNFIGGNGVTLAEMRVNRSVDGGPIAPRSNLQ